MNIQELATAHVEKIAAKVEYDAVVALDDFDRVRFPSR
mgnify:CR=1 FL=1